MTGRAKSPAEGRYQGDNHGGTPRTSPYPTSRLSAPISLVDTAREIQAASDVIAGHTGARLSEIAAQIRHLQSEAQAVLERARADIELHRAECRFQRTVGKTYHLYERADGSRFFSMLSVDDYGGRPQHAFVGSYRLEADRSWTPADETPARDRANADIDALLSARLLPR